MGENSTFELLWVGSCSGGWPTLVGGWPTHNTCLLCCVLASCGQPVVFWPLVANPGQKFAGVVHVVHLVSGWDFKLQLLWVAIANPGQNFAGRPLADDCCQLLLPVEPTFAHRPLITMRSLRDHHKSTVEIQIQLRNTQIQLKYTNTVEKYTNTVEKWNQTPPSEEVSLMNMRLDQRQGQEPLTDPMNTSLFYFYNELNYVFKKTYIFTIYVTS